MEVDAKKLVIGMGLLFLLGILFAVLNGYYVEATDQVLPFIVYGIAIVSVIVGAFIVILFQWRVNRKHLERLLRVLPRDERIVIQLLLDNANKLEQNRMVALSGLSKVKVSRAVQRLEQKGVVEKKHLGNTNLVILKI